MLIIVMAAVFLVGAGVVWVSFMGVHRSLEAYGKKARIAARLTKEAVRRQAEAEDLANAAETRATAMEHTVLELERRGQEAARRQDISERNLEDLDRRTQEMDRRRLEAEHALQTTDRRNQDLGHRADEAQLRLKEAERELEAKRREVEDAAEDVRRKKREASEGIAAWTQAETERLTQRLNEQYASELAGMKKELADKLQSELEKIQAYFLEFAKSKTSLAGEDIQEFVVDKLSEIQKSM